MKRIPEVRGVMTPFPYSVEPTDDARTARGMMDEHVIRHLPVVSGAEIVGVLSERDLRVIDDIWGQGGGGVLVGKICSPMPYVVEHTARLDIVADEMAMRGIGSVIVTKDKKLVGVLTTTDICRFLADMLREQFRPPEGSEVA